MIDPFEKSAEWYDVIYADKPYDDEARRIAEAAFGPLTITHRSAVLEFGAGTGRYLSAFGKLYPGVTGVEPSEAMRAVAAKRGFNLLEGDTSCRAAPPADLVVALFNTFGYATVCDGKAHRVCVQMRERLRFGGAIAFDFINYAAALTALRTNEMRAYTNADGYKQMTRVTHKSFDPATSILEYRIFYVEDYLGQPARGWNETHRVRCYTPAEISAIVGGLGFQRYKIVDFNDPDRQPRADTWSCLCVANL